MSLVTKINDFVAAQTTLLMSTMWCVYVFLAWSLIPLAFPHLQNVVFYVSGGVIQLVALPLIMVGQNVISRSAEARAQQDHETLMAEFEEIKAMHQELHLVLAKPSESSK